MFQALFDFFYNLFVLEFPSGDLLEDGLIAIGGNKLGVDYTYNVDGTIATSRDMFANQIFLNLPSYFAFLCSLISLIIIVTLCALFVYKIIKLIGGLIR